MGDGRTEPLFDVLYLAACDWDAPWHGPQEIATRLAADGHRVTYVETLGRRRPNRHDLRRVVRRLGRAIRRPRGRTVGHGVSILSPVVIPGPRSRLARRLNLALLKRTLRAWSGHTAARPRILWIYTPTPVSLDLTRTWRGEVIVYHCTQSHRHRPGAVSVSEILEQELMARADLVIVDGIELLREREHLHRNVHRVPSGVNLWDELSARPPDWLRNLRRPVVGFLGSIDHRLDITLIAAAAQRHPEWTLALVGPVSDAQVAAIRDLPNVVLRGQVGPDQVPGILAGFDVGLLPYADIEMTRYTYPAKLHQYLAADLPIVSTPLPDLEEFRDYVEIGVGCDGFVVAAERALAAPPRTDRRRVAERNTWDVRYQEISRLLRRTYREAGARV